VHEGICPNCGIAYHKWQPKEASATAISPSESSEEGDGEFTQVAVTSLRIRFAAAFFYVPEKVDTTGFWGRVALWMAFTVWGISFFKSGISVTHINGSFLHAVNLPFHEFGHVLFSPFGRFMAILGGSLFQVSLPLIVLLVFALKYRDNFSAAIMLWWCGQNFIDISPYIQDAEYRSMPLIMGMGEEAHDWGNLLTTLGLVEHCYAYAKFSFSLGFLLMVVGIIWGGYILYKIKEESLLQ